MPAKRQGKKVLSKRLIHSVATNAANKDKMVTTSRSSDQSTEADGRTLTHRGSSHTHHQS